MISAAAYQNIIDEIKPFGATLVAVSKFKSVAEIKALYDLGHRNFGENYVQELVEKQSKLPEDIRWHFIGHLQTNKVKQIARFVHLIHSVDRFKLLKEINKQAQNQNRIIPCLLQMYIAEEDTKFGMDERDLIEFFDFFNVQKDNLKNVMLSGMMGMASFTDDETKINLEFKKLNALFAFAKSSYFIGQNQFKIRSMGMSNDYQLALKQGSNMLRIGSLLFGKRN